MEGPPSQTADCVRRPSTTLRVVPLPIFNGEDLKSYVSTPKLSRLVTLPSTTATSQ